jgi:GT2 family glycosyltransferase
MLVTYPKVVVIVLTWNSENDITECLVSLRLLRYPNYEIIVVDNASTDRTPNIVKHSFPDVTLIINKKNLGFGGGFNVGIKEAIKKKADYIVCLNSDVVVDEHFLLELVKVGELSEKVGGLCPIAYYYDQPNRINGAGGIVRIIHPKVFGCGEIDKGQYSKTKETRMLCGPALVLKRKAFLGIGFFNTEYFYGPEDMDIALRLLKNGYKILFAPRAKLWHKGRGAVGGKITPLIIYFHVRNFLLFVKKHANNKLELFFSILYFWFFDFPTILLKALIFGNKDYVDAAVKGIIWHINAKLLPSDEEMVKILRKR